MKWENEARKESRGQGKRKWGERYFLFPLAARLLPRTVLPFHDRAPKFAQKSYFSDFWRRKGLFCSLYYKWNSDNDIAQLRNCDMVQLGIQSRFRRETWITPRSHSPTGAWPWREPRVLLPTVLLLRMPRVQTDITLVMAHIHDILELILWSGVTTLPLPELELHSLSFIRTLTLFIRMWDWKRPNFRRY